MSCYRVLLKECPVNISFYLLISFYTRARVRKMEFFVALVGSRDSMNDYCLNGKGVVYGKGQATGPEEWYSSGQLQSGQKGEREFKETEIEEKEKSYC